MDCAIDNEELDETVCVGLSVKLELGEEVIEPSVEEDGNAVAEADAVVVPAAPTPIEGELCNDGEERNVTVPPRRSEGVAVWHADTVPVLVGDGEIVCEAQGCVEGEGEAVNVAVPDGLEDPLSVALAHGERVAEDTTLKELVAVGEAVRVGL